MSLPTPPPRPPLEPPPPEALEGKALALDYEAVKVANPRRRDVTAPLNPTHLLHPPPPRRASLWGVFLVFGLIWVLVFSLLALTPTAQQQLADLPSAAVENTACLVTSPLPLAVYAAPNPQASRLWTLEAGGGRLAFERFGAGWLRLANGWVRDETLSAEGACAVLPVAETPRSFEDAPLLPPEIATPAWERAALETFADPAQAWLKDEANPNLLIREGALLMFASPDTVSQTRLPQAYALPVHYALQLTWVASDLEARLGLVLDTLSLWLGRNGHLRLEQDGKLVALREGLILDDAYSVGFAFDGVRGRVYLEKTLVLETEAASPSGPLNLRLEGEQAVLRLERLEVWTRPRP